MSQSNNAVPFDDILSAAVHDVKNSLSIVVTRLDEFSANYPTGGSESRSLSEIRYEIQRINSNLVRLLTLHKIDEQRYALDVGMHAVADLLNEIVLNHKALLDGRGVQVEVDCPDGLHWYFDYNLLVGVLGNALNNAIRYTRSRVRLSAQIGTDTLSIHVDDDGPGFPEAMLVHPVLNRDARPERGFINGNTGLGLYFSEFVAQMHRNGERSGRMSLENAGPLGGGRFVFRLP